MKEEKGLPVDDRVQYVKVKNYSVSASSFCMIIMPSVITESRLALSRKFSAQYGDELSNVVRLIIPVTGIWNVGVEKSGNLLWFHDGWKEFMEHINYGYFLTFKYSGNSEFNVHIFDLTATEIKYPSNSERGRHVNKGPESKRVQSFDEEEEEEEEHNASSPNPNQEIKGRREKASPICRDLVHELNEIEDDFNKKRPSSSIKRKSCFPEKRVKTKRGSNEETERALDAASMYKPANPSFTTVIKKYNLAMGRILLIPANFAREHLYGFPKFIELQDSNKKWTVRCVTRHHLVLSISKGWSEFAKEKNLAIGDVCVFELIKSDAVLKVSIFRVKEDPVLAN